MAIPVPCLHRQWLELLGLGLRLSYTRSDMANILLRKEIIRDPHPENELIIYNIIRQLFFRDLQESKR